MSLTIMFTSVTRRPVRLSTRLMTLRRTASVIWGIDWAVLYGRRQVYGGLFFVDLGAHAPGVVHAARAAGHAASHALQESTNGRRAAAHLYPLHLRLQRRDAR